MVSTIRSSSSKAKAAKRAKKTNDKAEIVDYTRSLQLVPGSRLKVRWTLENEGGECMEHWWGATMMEHDGRLHDGAAIHSLEYDAYPEGGFIEKTEDDVIFSACDTLVRFPSKEKLNFKVLADDGLDIQHVTAGEMRGILNERLASALDEVAGQLDEDHPRRLAIVSLLNRKKAETLRLFEDHFSTSPILTKQNMLDIMAQVVSNS